MPWVLPIVFLEIVGGAILFNLSLTSRWVNWCMDKPFAIPYFVLALAFWGIAGGMLQLLRLLEALR